MFPSPFTPTPFEACVRNTVITAILVAYAWASERSLGMCLGTAEVLNKTPVGWLLYGVIHGYITLYLLVNILGMIITHGRGIPFLTIQYDRMTEGCLNFAELDLTDWMIW